MDALTAITKRHSTRAFTAEPIPRELLEKIVDAGRLAPTARNEQPWEFVVVTDAAMRRRLAEVTDYGSFLADAAACVAVFCREAKYFLEDGCLAAANMLLAATALGLQSCWVAGDKKAYCEAVAEALGVPPGYRLVSLLAIGHGRGEQPRAPERSLAEVAHWERW